jgi:hypothetical protein
MPIPPGAWFKTLVGNTVGNNTTLTLTESLILTSGSLTSWTETLLSSNWQWDDGILVAAGCSLCDVPFYIGTILGDTISFGPLFNVDTSLPDSNPINITIEKHLSCHVNDGCVQPVNIVENAAPEPGTLLLLAGGLAGLAGLRRRRYA